MGKHDRVCLGFKFLGAVSNDLLTNRRPEHVYHNTDKTINMKYMNRAVK